MYGNRPLFATGSDAKLFVWTHQANEFLSALRGGQSALIVGDPGSGKTSLLHMVEMKLKEDRLACFASLAFTRDSGQAVATVYRELARRGFLSAPDDDLLDAALNPGDPFAPTQLLRDLARVSAPVTVLCDDLDGAVGHRLFGALRDELWQLPLVWAAAVTPDQAGGLMTPPADVFFERQIPLKGLTSDERVRLLELRNSYGPDSLSATQIERLARHGPETPRRLIVFAREAAEMSGTASPQRQVEGIELRRQAAEATAGRAGAMLVTELEGLGPVSASDEALLERLGWTRPRATGVLNELEDAGIVTSFSEPRDGRLGRPRKLYELRGPGEFLPALR